MKKFFKRKFLYPILYGLFLVANHKLNLGLGTEECLALGGVAACFVAGEAHVDAKATMGTELVEKIVEKRLNSKKKP